VSYARKIRSLIATFFVATSAHAATPGWDELVRASYEYTNEQQDKLEKDFSLSKHERWDLDQDKGELVFSSGGTPAVIAKFQFVGSLSNTSHTWLWGWGNESILPELSSKIKVVREYGEKNDLKKLKDRKWDAEEVDGWEMAAITNYLLKAKGVYRPPYSNGLTFIVITDIEWAKPK
jgi:hypothetical protein